MTIFKALTLLSFLFGPSALAEDHILSAAERSAHTGYFTPLCGTPEATQRGYCVTDTECHYFIHKTPRVIFEGEYRSPDDDLGSHWSAEANCKNALKIYLARNRIKKGDGVVSMTTVNIMSGTKVLATIPAGRRMLVKDVWDGSNIYKDDGSTDWHARKTNEFWVKVTTFGSNNHQVTGWILSRYLQNY